MSIRRNRHSTAVWQRWLVFIGVSLAVAACGGEPTAIPEPDATVLGPPTGAVGGPAPSSASGPTVFFLLQPPTVGDRVNMMAGGNAELVLDEGCLRTGSADGDLIIWPPGFSLTTEDDGVQILNETGQIVARVGEKVRMGGGQISYPSVLGEYVLRQLPSSCPGPYLVVGSVPTGPPQNDPYKLSSE